MDTTDDHALAARIAEECGRALVELRERAQRHGSPAGPALGHQGDRASHDRIVAALAEARPDDVVRSEEGGRDHGAAPAGERHRRLWVVDPLDGTREYAEGRADFAVHVALVVGEDPVVGAVALPAEGLVFATGGAASPTPVARGDGPVRIAVSRTRPPVEATRVATHLGAELVPMGSAGAKVMAVVRGTVDVYVHGGGQYEWDSAAPVAVARAHGMHASRLDGAPLRYGAADPWLPDLLVCRPELVDVVAEALRS
ncbi:MAG: 3'(2'),5'-bisphosphate nucleotidase CysQ [Acidimicrobiales bacterium]